MYSSPNIIRIIKSRRKRRSRHMAFMGKTRGAHRVLMWKLEGGKKLEDLGLDGKFKLTCILKKWHRGHRLL
jgi:hypothetical protein